MLPDNYGDNPWSANVAASGGGLGGILAKLFGGGQSAQPAPGQLASLPLPPPRPVGIGAPMPPPRPEEFSSSTPNEITVTPSPAPSPAPAPKFRVITPGSPDNWAPSPFLWSGRVR